MTLQDEPTYCTLSSRHQDLIGEKIDAKTMAKRSLSEPKVTPDRPKNGPKSPQNGAILVPKWSQNALYIARDMVKIR